ILRDNAGMSSIGGVATQSGREIFTVRNEGRRKLDLGIGDSGSFKGSPRDEGGRRWPGEAKPPWMVLRSTPYCLQLSRLSMEIHDKGWSDLFFLLKTALRWRDDNRSWITISVRHASSRFTGGFLFRRVHAVLGRG
ncbi:hypothetical protein ISN45_Aa04g006810, partial [Arabidopsis thaliana x Arabidopsis arenosa]